MRELEVLDTDECENCGEPLVLVKYPALLNPDPDPTWMHHRVTSRGDHHQYLVTCIKPYNPPTAVPRYHTRGDNT